MVKKIVLYITLLSVLFRMIDVLSVEEDVAARKKAAANLVYDKRLAQKAAAEFNKKLQEGPDETADPVTLSSYSELLEKAKKPGSHPILACVEKKTLKEKKMYFIFLKRPA